MWSHCVAALVAAICAAAHVVFAYKEMLFGWTQEFVDAAAPHLANGSKMGSEGHTGSRSLGEEAQRI
jgi:hypothetical protein